MIGAAHPFGLLRQEKREFCGDTPRPRRGAAPLHPAGGRTSAAAGAELVGEEGHDDGVPVAAVGVAVLAQAARLDEAALAVAGDGAGVALVRVEHDATEVHLVEGEAKEGEDGVRAVAAAPEVLVADHDAERSLAVLGGGGGGVGVAVWGAVGRLPSCNVTSQNILGVGCFASLFNPLTRGRVPGFE